MFRKFLIFALFYVVVAEVPWKEEIRTKLVGLYQEKNVDSLVRIFYYLDEEERLYKWNDVNENAASPPAWKTLKSTLKSDEVFEKYADRLAEDTKRAEVDEAFRKTMSIIYSQMMDATQEAHSEVEGFDLIHIIRYNMSQTSGLIGLARAWSLIPLSSQGEILSLIPKVVRGTDYGRMATAIVERVNRKGGLVVMRELAALSLSAGAIQNLIRYMNGEISGRRCAKNIVDATFTIGAGIGGGIGGAAIGSLAGPIGTVIGGILGGYITSQGAQYLSDRLTQSLFGIPREEALEKAYDFFGVNMTASNDEINGSFRKLALKHHPDKGGKSEDFIKVQVNLGIIKNARGEYF